MDDRAQGPMMNERRTDLNVFWFSLLVTVVASLLVQLVIVPSIPAINGGDGLLSGGDAVGFQSVALHLVDQMRAHGWSAWQLRPNTWAPAGVAAAFYYITGINEPYVLIPMNCLLYSGGVYFFTRSMALISNFRLYWLAVAMLLLFPSSLIIYTQISKDIFTFFGVSIFLFFLATAAKGEATSSFPFGFIALSIIACAFIWIGRPYLLKVTVASLAGTYVFVLGWSLIKRKHIRFILLAILILVPLAFSFLGADDKGVLAEAPAVSTTAITVATPPVKVEHGGVLGKLLNTVNVSRQNFLASFQGAGSNIDQSVFFHSYADVLLYIPRALEIGFAAPFPTSWFGNAVENGGRLMRLVSALEMTLAYISYIGIGLLFLNRRIDRYTAAIVLLFCTAFIMVYVLFIPNVGSLYRMRYPYWQLAISLGVLGWIGLWERKRARQTESNATH